MSALGWDRLQFAFTITYHYLFPQLTMGLALLIVVMKGLALRSGGDSRSRTWDDLAQFWAKIFALNFGVGVVTGIPMEFQFGTNWARFSSATGGVIGSTLALEGLFAFFAESVFLGLFLYGKKRLTPRTHFLSAFMVFAGSWLSGYFIVVTNAFMQYPTGYAKDEGGRLVVSDAGQYLANPWALWEYAHTMTAAAITGAFVVTAVAAYWTLRGQYAGSRARGAAPRCLGRAHRVHPAHRSHGRSAREAPRRAPAGGPGGDGGEVRERLARGAGDHRAARRRRASTGEPDYGAAS